MQAKGDPPHLFGKPPLHISRNGLGGGGFATHVPLNTLEKGVNFVIGLDLGRMIFEAESFDQLPEQPLVLNTYRSIPRPTRGDCSSSVTLRKLPMKEPSQQSGSILARFSKETPVGVWLCQQGW